MSESPWLALWVFRIGGFFHPTGKWSESHKHRVGFKRAFSDPTVDFLQHPCGYWGDVFHCANFCCHLADLGVFMSQFELYPINEKIKFALQGMGYVNPTEIQSKVIPKLLELKSSDLVALSETGSGKTAAFGIPLAEKLDSSLDQVQALILSPTRELAAQIEQTLEPIIASMDLKAMTVYGGQSYHLQKGRLKRKPQIIIATPGRLIDLINQKVVDLKYLKVLVLDEADRMLSMGFEEDLKFILKSTHSSEETESSRASCQTWLFSATMGPGIRRLLNRYLNKPEIIELVKENQGVSTTLKHTFVAVRGGNRANALLRILKSVDEFYGIVFCQTKKDVSIVEEILVKNNIRCMSLHGDKVQKERERILASLKDGKFSVLIATDVAARGLDVKSLKQVVHYSLPYEIESYVHRSGRTGRAGEEGLVISIVEPSDFSKLNRLKRTAGVNFVPFETKTAEQIVQGAVFNQLGRLSRMNIEGEKLQVINRMIKEYLQSNETIFSETSEWLSAMFLAQGVWNGGSSDDFIIKDFSMDKSAKGVGKSAGGAGSSRGFERGEGRRSSGGRREEGRFGSGERRRSDRRRFDSDGDRSYSERSENRFSSDRRERDGDYREDRRERKPDEGFRKGYKGAARATGVRLHKSKSFRDRYQEENGGNSNRSERKERGEHSYFGGGKKRH